MIVIASPLFLPVYLVDEEESRADFWLPLVSVETASLPSNENLLISVRQQEELMRESSRNEICLQSYY